MYLLAKEVQNEEAKGMAPMELMSEVMNLGMNNL